MSKVYRDGDPKWLSRRLADHLTIGPDGMTPADRWLAGHESEGLLDVSISSGTPVSITPPYLGDAHTFVLELLTQEVLASAGDVARGRHRHQTGASDRRSRRDGGICFDRR